jgi:hypothetical protein
LQEATTGDIERETHDLNNFAADLKSQLRTGRGCIRGERNQVLEAWKEATPKSNVWDALEN